ncbi:hypothetical protein ACFSKW_23255 [Nonomuraea mangrovi]|uniref:Uncharacterized protein n=1 Tax=Nonomuraea mangrovi TaxID=2316207 RepID=A0ABW4SZ04_9ACTN
MLDLKKTLAAATLAASAMVVPMTLSAQPAVAAPVASTAHATDASSVTCGGGGGHGHGRGKRAGRDNIDIRNSNVGVGNGNGNGGGNDNDDNVVVIGGGG